MNTDKTELLIRVHPWPEFFVGCGSVCFVPPTTSANAVHSGGQIIAFRGLSSLTKARQVDRRQKTIVCPTWSLFK
jgi:hypothetical protein